MRPGDGVVICTGNRLEYALALFAAIRAGAVAVPLHHHLRAPEVRALAQQARARAVIVDPELRVRLPGVRTITAGPGGALDEATAQAGPAPAASGDPDAPAAILFTSGTTGRPKGATLTSRSLLAVARLGALVPWGDAKRGVCGLPLAHVMGLSTLLFSAMAGTSMHWFGRFDARKVLSAIERRRATFFVGVPAMYAMMAEAGPESRDLTTVKLWLSGADAMPPPLVERFCALGCALRTPLGRPLLGAAFAEVYGMVELSGPAIIKVTPPRPRAGRLSARLAEAAERARRLAARVPALARLAEQQRSAFGLPIPPYRVRIVDDEGRQVRASEVGELLVRGPGVTVGYDRDPEATGRATQEGWLHTGDLARRSALGLIAFVTRKKDVIKHGGFSVFPAEVEAQLAAHPAVAEAVVLGVPHPTKGAVPAAVVTLAGGHRATEAELLAWARENIAPFKAPRAVVVLPSSEIPRNANRKVPRDELCARVLPELEQRLAEASRTPGRPTGKRGR